MKNFMVMIHLALKNLLVNKRRSFLTMLGIIIGIASVVLVMSLGAGAQELILNQIKQRGTDEIGILAGASDENGPPAQAFGIVITTLTYDDGVALFDKKNVAHIKAVAGYISGNDVLRWSDTEKQVTYTGSNASYQELERVTLAKGRFFDKTEEENGDHVMVLGSEIAEDIFGNQDPVGEFVKLKRKNFKIIGVLAPKGSSGFENPDIAVVIPLRVAQEELLGVKHVSFLRAIVDNESHIDQTVEEVRQTLIERHDNEDFSVRTIADLLNTLTVITNVLKFFLVFVASIALFVGGVGIMNIMLIAVKEKTQEIGLRKAVGASNRDILIQFLTETIMIALIGGVIGITIGVVVSFVIAQVIQSLGYTYLFILSPLAMLVSFLVACVIGLMFGVVPAKKAANLSPIDALRYE